nr:(d)CMP kinase [Propionibacterium sp.]
MTSQRLVIAIDGPAGSGKSTTAKEVARRLGLGYLDTGAMYRAVTLAVLDSGVAHDDPDAVARVTRDADVAISLDPDDFWVRVGGRDVTGEIRGARVTENASLVSTNPDCRADLVRRQRALMDAAPRGVVAEGRDITTVVYPDADLRVLLTASPEVRLARRRGDVGASVSAEQLRTQVLARDAADSKLVEFQTAADGVRLLDTTDLTLDDVVATIIDLAQEGRP